MNRSNVLGSVLTALVFTFPVTTDALSSLASVVPSRAELRQQAIQDRTAKLTQRRSYSLIVAECARRQTAGEKVVCPDINDVQGIVKFMRGEQSSSSTAAGTGSVVLRLEDVTESDLGLLRRYRNAQQCPEGLKTGKQPGFYALCLSFIKDGRVSTLKNRQIERKVLQKIEGLKKMAAPTSSAPTLNDRLNALPKGIRPDR